MCDGGWVSEMPGGTGAEVAPADDAPDPEEAPSRRGWGKIVGQIVLGVATVVGSLFADIAYSLLDPRIRYVDA